MHAFITGDAGFIGSHLADVLIARGDTVAILDKLNRKFEDLPADVREVK